ncbi:zinc-dependent metalloprotease [Hymenobacter ginsengisoli]|uniref:Zinc-dependent metalloprotease n=1 Tax=Hymenobacter ginsengisoli TaxID=1051626 RepID=A0ABP8QMI5_9BACT|nr:MULTISPECIES: zinc-dependent metalloprotease [unclassified Hymenobacter]MBO2031026.1 zinc-dependent metalloprotease [Hymenobacter sp. BT559]
MKHFLLFSATLLATAQLAVAQAPASTGAPASPRTDAKPAASLGTITQGLKKYDGYFPFYYDDKTGKVYLEVSRFDQEFLYFSSLTNGVGLGGPERGGASSAIAKFVKVGPKVMLLEPNYAYRASGKNPDEQRAAESAFAKSVIWGFAPVAVEGDKVLLDLTPFLVRDSQKLTDQLGRRNFAGLRGGASGPAPAPYRFDETRSAVYPDNTKNFPKNTEFEALVTFVGGPSSGGNDFGFGSAGLAPDPNAVTVRMHQSFVELPPPGFEMRPFDPRSGFNPFTYQDFSVPMTEPLEQRSIRRHRLEKKNPGAKISDPVAPIVYYVDRGAPPDIKRALIEGGSWWNQAFEAAGYRNAFIVKELPEGADPMDIRYNVVNWVDRAGNPRAFSFGSSYIDPRTGEIIKGVVTLGSDRHRQDYLLAEGLLQPYKTDHPDTKPLQELALARVRQLSAHEIGHTLGLFHNFAASVRDRSSVMDYPFPRIVLKADGTLDVSKAYDTGIGSWDKRAILWGYQDFPKGTNEAAGLAAIMKETLAQGHLFAYDPTISLHPLSSQWDDGSDPVAQLTQLMAVRRHVLDTFSANALPTGAPLATLEDVLVPMYLLHRYQVAATAKTLGGLYFTPAVKGDGQVPTRLVAPAEQWKALNALLATISPAALVLPEKLLTQLPPRPAGYSATVETPGSRTGIAFDPLAVAEAAAAPTLAVLLNPERAARLIEYQARDAEQPGFLPVVDKLLAQTWKAPLAAGYPGEVQIVVNNVTLKYLLQLAADANASETVRGQGLLAVDNLKQWMTNQLPSATPRQKASLLFGLAQIRKFEDDPNKFTPAPALDMPPGAPIGMPGLDFLGDEVTY